MKNKIFVCLLLCLFSILNVSNSLEKEMTISKKQSLSERKDENGESETSWASYISYPVNTIIRGTYNIVDFSMKHPTQSMITILLVGSQLSPVDAQYYYNPDDGQLYNCLCNIPPCTIEKCPTNTTNPFLVPEVLAAALGLALMNCVRNWLNQDNNVLFQPQNNGLWRYG